MLKKLKTKFNRKLASKIALFVFILSSFLVFAPQAVIAATEADGANCTEDRSTSRLSGKRVCDLSKIILTTDIQINGQSGNFIKVSPTDSATFTVTIKLSQPSDLNVGSYSSAADLVFFSSGLNWTISGFGATLVPQDTTSYCSIVGATNRSYTKCTNDARLQDIIEPTALTKFTSGTVVYTKTFTVSPADFQKLGIVNVKDSASGKNGLNLVYVYPNLAMDGPLSTSADWTTYFKGGKELYVQLFASTDALKNDNSTPPQCSGNPTVGTSTPLSCVPVSGNVTAGGNSTADNGNALIDLINRIIGLILGVIQEFIYAVFFWLIAPLIQAMLSVHPYTDTFVAVIYPGWEVVRNLCNIFFILALIIIAMATLFRVDSYKFKDLIVQLIIAALLVNFSLVIAQIILGLADTIQAQFLPANVTVIRSLAADLMVTNYREAVFQSGFGSQGTFAATVQPLFYLALSLGSFAVFCAICVFLVVRVVMLWLLLLISPIAYAVGVLPATAKYRGEWWSNFLKYAFFTPLMAFFLNMAAIISNSSKENPVLQEINGLAAASSLGNSDIASFVLKVGSNLLLLIFLIAALKVAEQAGIYGASGITEIAKKGIFAPFAAAGFGAKAAGGYVGRKWNEFTANKIRGDARKVSGIRGAAYALLNPVAFGKSWAKESERKKHSAQEKAEMAGLEVVQQRFDSPKAFFKGSYKIEPHVLQHEKHHEDEKAKNLQNMSRENVAQTAAEYFLLGDDEDSKAYKRGVIKLAMSKGYIDDIVEEAWKTKEGRKMIEQMEKVADRPLVKGQDYEEVDLTELDDHGHERVVMGADGKPVKTKKMLYNHITRRAMYKAMFGVDSHGHLKDHAAMRLITEEGEKEGMDTGHLEYMTDMYFNNKTGNYEFYKLNEVKDSQGNVTGYTSEGDQRMAGAEIAKRNSRTQAGIAWHSLMSSSGTTLYEDVFAKVAKAISENPTFMQERTANMLVAGDTKEELVEKIVKDYKINGQFTLDEKNQERLNKIWEINQKSFIAIISRFINDATPQALEKRMKEGVVINGREYKPKMPKTEEDRIKKEGEKEATQKRELEEQKEQTKAYQQAIVDLAKQLSGNPQRGSKRRKK